MKTLVVGMQSSGASFVTFSLAQRPGTIAVVDLYCQELAPSLDAEARQFDVLLKCTITAAIPLTAQIKRFRPDRIVLVTRNVDAIRQSLCRKPWRDQAGTMGQKLAVYQDLLLRRLDQFDQIICYERFIKQPREIVRSPEDILGFNAAHSSWACDNYKTRWGFGALRLESMP